MWTKVILEKCTITHNWIEKCKCSECRSRRSRLKDARFLEAVKNVLLVLLNDTEVKEKLCEAIVSCQK